MLIANKEELDLGTLKFGVPYSFKYVLTNNSEESITITKLILGCNSCTKAYCERSVVGPHESTDINVTFTPGSTGMNLKKISVQYTSGGKLMRGLELKFKAKINV